MFDHFLKHNQTNTWLTLYMRPTDVTLSYKPVLHHLNVFFFFFWLTDGTMDFLTMKQDLEGFFKSASLSAKAFSSLCNETADHQEDFGLSVVMKEIDAAVPKLHSSAGDLLRLIKVLGGVNCLNSGMLTSTNNRQMTGGPRADLAIHMWGRSRDSVRVAVAKWNYEALLREKANSARKRTV